jgi:hypothetical protein
MRIDFMLFMLGFAFNMISFIRLTTMKFWSMLNLVFIILEIFMIGYITKEILK